MAIISSSHVPPPSAGAAKEATSASRQNIPIDGGAGAIRRSTWRNPLIAAADYMETFIKNQAAQDGLDHFVRLKFTKHNNAKLSAYLRGDFKDGEARERALTSTLAPTYDSFRNNFEVECDKGTVSKSLIESSKALLSAVLGPLKDHASAQKKCKELILREHPDKLGRGTWRRGHSPDFHAAIFRLIQTAHKVLGNDQICAGIFPDKKDCSEKTFATRLKGFFLTSL